MDEDYDVVTDVLKKHLNVLLEMINSNAEQGSFNGTDQIRLDQINQLDRAIRMWRDGKDI